MSSEEILRKLKSQYAHWDNHPEYPVEDWMYEVNNEDTRSSYWEWVVSQIENEEITENEKE